MYNHYIDTANPLTINKRRKIMKTLTLDQIMTSLHGTGFSPSACIRARNYFVQHRFAECLLCASDVALLRKYLII
jgi:hypothetical protein